MPFEIEYGTFANYSPRGTSNLSEKSRKICGAIKAGKTSVIDSAIPHLKKPKSDILQPFLNPGALLLVPVPRSAPLAHGALWPAKVIADRLLENGFGGEVVPLIDRVKAVRKSSNSPATERPLIHEHIDSLEVAMTLANPTQITLVDDVLTMGRTMCACAKILMEKFPETKIRVFAMIRTQGLISEIEKLVDPSVGTIIGYPSGKSHRDP